MRSPSFITVAGLRNAERIALREGRTMVRAASAATSTVFISHAHEDRDLVRAAAAMLAVAGGKVYVDWLDPSMSATTTSKTAALLKEKISSLGKMLVIASKRAQDSRWVPWEIGYADGVLAPGNVAVLPIADNSSDWVGAEYLGLYPTILLTDSDEIGVFSPGETRTSLMLDDWLNA